MCGVGLVFRVCMLDLFGVWVVCMVVCTIVHLYLEVDLLFVFVRVGLTWVFRKCT